MLRSNAEFYKDLSDQVPSDASDTSQVDAKEMADLMKVIYNFYLVNRLAYILRTTNVFFYILYSERNFIYIVC